MALNNISYCELVYLPFKQSPFLFSCLWVANMTVANLIQQSGIEQEYPEVSQLQIGIFARKVTRDTILKPGDRVELYRPLHSDPKEKRRRKAKSS